MKESHGKGVANPTDLESCEADREARPEALTEARTGSVLGREITSGVSTMSQYAEDDNG